MERMGYQSATLGEKEFYHGIPFLKEQIRKHPGLFVSANVTDAATDKPFAQPYVIRTYPDSRPGATGKIRVAVTGVLGTREAAELPIILGTDASKVKVADPIETLKALVPTLRQRADLVVVLAHAGMDGGRDIANAVPGIDLMALGHVPGVYFNETPNVNGATLVASGDRARYGSQAGITLDGMGGKTIRSRTTALTASIPENPKFAELRDSYKPRLSQMQGGLVTEKEQTPTAQFFKSDSSNRYMGNRACAECHKKVYDKWSLLSHAKALRTLETTKKGINAKRPDCLRCHTVGFGQPSGFNVAEYPRELGGVGCESCHGPGQLHISLAKAGLKRAVMTTRSIPQGNKTLCIQCHDSINDPDFNFEKDLQKIKHWGPEFAEDRG